MTRAAWTMTTEIARFMRKLERRWDDHREALFVRRDVDAAMADMAAASSVRHIPTMTGADGRPTLERFYRDVVLPHLPGALGFTRRSRTVDRFHLVDELTVSFLHDREVPWSGHRVPGIVRTRSTRGSQAASGRSSASSGTMRASSRCIWCGCARRRATGSSGLLTQ